jgi:hypothetical protein
MLEPLKKAEKGRVNRGDCSKPLLDKAAGRDAAGSAAYPRVIRF